MDRLLQILKEIRPDVDFENETELIEDGVLDSFDLLSIIEDVNSEFDIELKVSELTPENFASLQSIWKLIENNKK